MFVNPRFAIASSNVLSIKGSRFFELTAEDMKRCKQLVFPAEIFVDKNKNVYTNEISAIFSGREIEKDTEVPLKSNVVQDVGKCLHEIEVEISRWRDILETEYSQYLRGGLNVPPIVDLH